MHFVANFFMYRAPLQGWTVLLSTTQAGPGWNFSQPRARLLVEPSAALTFTEHLVICLSPLSRPICYQKTQGFQSQILSTTQHCIGQQRLQNCCRLACILRVCWLHSFTLTHNESTLSSHYSDFANTMKQFHYRYLLNQRMLWKYTYRVTHQVHQNLSLTLFWKLRFSIRSSY